MPRMFDVYTIELTDQNIPHILEITRPLGWTLDHLQDNMEINTEDGFDTYLFMKLFSGTTEIATFFDECLDGFDDISDRHRMTDTIDPLFGIFRKVEKI